MHDLKIFREQLDLLRDGLRRRGALDALAPVLDSGVTLERERRTLIQAVEERKAARNANAQEVAKRKRAKEDADDLIAQGRELGDEIGRLETDLGGVEAELQRLLLEIPNVTLPQVPGGDASALKLTLISIVIAFAAIFASEAVARAVSRRVRSQ